MGLVAMSATSFGMRRHVIASVDIPSTKSWQMSSPDRTFIRASALGVGRMVVLCCQLAGEMLPLGSAVGS